ncbi:Aldehyde dehydrogenase [hydrothermal vent metagenome]|uniref:Aldehyde dehydrogenase n=1 Tax=hydrothermal vent metagenome TaxID=652676 RepID=A0A1W1D386_9ZZZZ
MKFADPKNDFAFKKIFGNEQYKNILISFLNAVLDFQNEKSIVDVSLANPYQIPKIPDLKETILDIKATNQKGETFIVEMQKKDIGDFAKRSLFYTSKAYVSQLPKGNDYATLKKVYFIGILNFEMFENKNYISRHLIINQETKMQDLKDFEFNFIELSKFHKKLDELETLLDKWIYFLKYAGDLTLIPKEYADIREFQEAFLIATQTMWDKEEIEVYDYVSLKEIDDMNALKTATKKGFEKGRQEGMVQGKKEGEKQKAIEIAKNLLDVLDDEMIALKTGLDKEEVRHLR